MCMETSVRAYVHANACVRRPPHSQPLARTHTCRRESEGGGRENITNRANTLMIPRSRHSGPRERRQTAITAGLAADGSRLRRGEAGSGPRRAAPVYGDSRWGAREVQGKELGGGPGGEVCGRHNVTLEVTPSRAGLLAVSARHALKGTCAHGSSLEKYRGGEGGLQQHRGGYSQSWRYATTSGNSSCRHGMCLQRHPVRTDSGV